MLNQKIDRKVSLKDGNGTKADAFVFELIKGIYSPFVEIGEHPKGTALIPDRFYIECQNLESLDLDSRVEFSLNGERFLVLRNEIEVLPNEKDRYYIARTPADIFEEELAL